MSITTRCSKPLAFAVSVLFAAGLAATPCSAYANSEPQLAGEKTETVNVTANANGGIEKVEVENALKNKDSSELMYDSTELVDVKGKDKATYETVGDGLVWRADGDNIVYTGTTDKHLPITMYVTYRLNGLIVNPDEIVGKSGDVSIRYDFVNDYRFDANVNGSNVTMCMPFTCLTALMLNGDNFTNVKVTNGKVISDDSDAIIMGYAMPGLKASLGPLAEKADVPEYIEVTATTTNFDLKSSMTIVTAGMMSDIDIEGMGFEDLDDMSSGLGEGMSSLVSGARSLTDGLNALADGASTLGDGTNSLADGVSALDDGAGTLVNGAKKLDNGAGALAGGTDSLNEGVGALVGGVKSLKKGADALAGGAGSVNDGASELAGGVKSLKKGADALAGGAGSVNDGAGELAGGVKSLNEGANTLAGGASSVNEGASGLAEGASSLSYGLNLLEYGEDGNSGLKGAAASAEQLVGAMDEVASSLNAVADPASGLPAAAGGLAQLSAAMPDAKTIAALEAELAASDLDANTLQAVIGILESTKQIEPLSSGVSQASDGITQIAGGYSVIVEQAGQLPEGLKAASDATEQLYQGSTELAGGAKELADGTSELAGGAKELAEGTSGLAKGAKELSEGTSELAGGAKELAEGTSGLAKGAKELNDGSSEVAGGAKELSEGTSGLAKGAKELADGTSELAGGAKELADGTSDLSSGVRAAADGSNELSDGLVKFDNEGISKIISTINDDIGGLKKRIQILSDKAASFDTFSGKAEGTPGTVKFIFETAAVEAKK